MNKRQGRIKSSSWTWNAGKSRDGRQFKIISVVFVLNCLNLYWDCWLDGISCFPSIFCYGSTTPCPYPARDLLSQLITTQYLCGPQLNQSDKKHIKAGIWTCVTHLTSSQGAVKGCQIGYHIYVPLGPFSFSAQLFDCNSQRN
jgi:hypothetical protein